MSDGKILIRNKVNYVRLLEMNTSKVGKIEIDLPLSEVCRYRTKLLLPMGRPIRFQKTKVMVPSTFTRSQPLRSSDIPQIYKLVANACLALPAASGSMRSLANWRLSSSICQSIWSMVFSTSGIFTTTMRNCPFR